MLGKRARVCFAISLGLVVVSIVLLVWGIPAIVNKQIQKASKILIVYLKIFHYYNFAINYIIEWTKSAVIKYKSIEMYWKFHEYNFSTTDIILSFANRKFSVLRFRDVLV